MRKIIIIFASISIIGLLIVGGIFYFQTPPSSPPPIIPQDTIPLLPPPPPDPNTIQFVDENNTSYDIKLINPTFLNNEKRNYYGNKAPNRLDVLWSHHLGTGTTHVGGPVQWSGAGWTGQPLMVIENGKKYIIQGAYDHHLKKIDVQTGELVWQYKFDDVIKGTGTIWINHEADSLYERVVIMQGSRSGTSLAAKQVPSFRAVSYFTGEELWRLNSVRTRCYSRDVDGSALVVNDTAYLGLENGIFTVFNPDHKAASYQDDMFQPQIYRNTDTLFFKDDSKKHGGNLVTEASPSRIGHHIYIASGSGHIWGYNLDKDTIDWEFFIGSDIDGSPIVTDDDCLLIAVEKQYIKGQGGLLKIDPSQSPENAALWYYPVEDFNFASWKGGIIGSAGVNDAYRDDLTIPNMAAIVAIDGFTYVVNTKITTPNDSVLIFDGETYLPKPQLIFKYKTGPSIATPLFVQDKLIVTGYGGVHLFEYDNKLNFKLLDHFSKTFESTAFVDDERIYVASRDGNLYCFGVDTAKNEQYAQRLKRLEAK